MLIKCMKCCLAVKTMKFEIVNGILIIHDYNKKKKELINLHDCIKNMSNIPFGKYNDRSEIDALMEGTLCSICMQYARNYSTIFNVNISEKNNTDLFINFFIAAFLLTLNRPSSSALIGCDAEIIYNVLGIIGEYNRSSEAVIIDREISNEGDNEYLSILEYIEKIPDVSLCVTDYNNTKLRDNMFDIIVVNGSVIEDEKVIKEINRIFKDGGLIIFVIDDYPEIKELLEKEYDNFEFYSVSETRKILIMKNKPLIPKVCSLFEKYEYLLNIEKEKLTKTKIRQIVNDIKYDIDYAASVYDAKEKNILIYLKENLISYMLFEEYREYHFEKIIECINGLKK